MKKHNCMDISNDKLAKSHMRSSLHDLKRETKSLIKVAKNDAIKTKVKIDKTLQYSKSIFCGDRDEMINHLISRYCKLGRKEYQTRHE